MMSERWPSHLSYASRRTAARITPDERQMIDRAIEIDGVTTCPPYDGTWTLDQAAYSGPQHCPRRRDRKEVTKGDCDDHIAALFDEGVNQKDIGAQLGVDENAMQVAVRRLRRSGRITGPSRDELGRQRREAVLRMLGEGKSRPEIAEALGLTVRHINTVVTRLRRAGHDIPYHTRRRPPGMNG